jgi:hypothetical protein
VIELLKPFQLETRNKLNKKLEVANNRTKKFCGSDLESNYVLPRNSQTRLKNETNDKFKEFFVYFS